LNNQTQNIFENRKNARWLRFIFHKVVFFRKVNIVGGKSNGCSGIKAPDEKDLHGSHGKSES
jgi:hypothetical protein